MLNLNILKRLEIIKNAIAIEEIELVDLQIVKLEAMELDVSVCNIIQLIKANDFEIVIEKIDQYRTDNTGLSKYEDPQIQGLKLELKVLENELSRLVDTKTGYEHQINSFNQQYTARLGSLISQILKLQEELAEEDSLEKEALHQEYEEFHKTYPEQLKEPVTKLDADQKENLKKAFRKASHLCHPDKLTDEHKAKGAEYFAALSEAYKQQDLEKVQEILSKLESGDALNITSDSVNNREKLLKQINYLKDRIATLMQEIEAIKQEETFGRLQKIEDMDIYFDNLEETLTDELRQLEEQQSK